MWSVQNIDIRCRGQTILARNSCDSFNFAVGVYDCVSKDFKTCLSQSDLRSKCLSSWGSSCTVPVLDLSSSRAALFARKVLIFWLYFHPSPLHSVPRDITASPASWTPQCSFSPTALEHWHIGSGRAEVWQCVWVCALSRFLFFFFPVFQVTSVHQSSFPGPLAAELNHSSLFLLSSFASKWCYVASLFPHHSWFHAFEWWACGKAIESEKYSN